MIARLASRQHGVVRRAQLLAAGLTRGEIEARVRTRRLLVLHRGVYAVGHRAVGARGRELAAVLACGRGAVLSHESAAALWGIRPPWRGDVHVIAGAGRERDGIHVHRTRSLPARDRTRHHGIPVTTPARTLLDLAAHLPAGDLERALAEAEVRRLVRRGALRPRARGDLAALLDGGGATRSELERRFLAFLAAHDMPRPRVNERVHGFEVDFHWPHARLVVELDGFAYHSTRHAFETDRARDAGLQAAGWGVVRITHRRLEAEPGRLAGQLRRLLTPGRARAPP